MSNRTFCIYIIVLLAGAAIVLYTHTHIEPKASVVSAHKEVAMMSDKDQERVYCLAYLTGSSTQGGTDQQIRDHCKKYTY